MEKRFRINPKYQLGNIIRKNLREENLRRSYDLNIAYTQAFPYASQDVYTPSNTGIATEFYPSVDEEGKIITPKENRESIFSGPLHFLFGDYEHARDRWNAASIQDAYHLWQEKRLLAEMTNRLNQVNEAKDNLTKLDEAELYANLIENRFALQELYKLAIETGDTERAIKIQEAFSENEKNILDFQEKIKTSGKKNDINVELFFDPSSAKSKEYLKSFAENFGGDPNIKGDWYNPLTGIEYGLSMIGNIAASAQQGVDYLLNTRYDKRKDTWNNPLAALSTKSSGNYIRRAIKQSLEDDKWTDPLFKAYDKDSLNGNGGDPSQLREKISNLRNYWNREYNERAQAEKETANKYKNGTWYFDPQKINPKFRYYSENNDAGILGGLLPDQLLYSIAETGSSYSDFVNMGAMMVSDAAAGALAKILATHAVKRSPYIAALTVLNDYRKLRAAGKMEEAAKMARLAQNAERTILQTANGLSALDAVLKTGTTASNIFFINRMREHETNSEVMDAWSSRVLTNAMRQNADMPGVLNKTRDYLQQMGIDPTNMTDIDLVQHALSYDIDTGDRVFEKEKDAARSGLKKVYNDNMALAVKDYLEAMPFLNYSGSFLRSFGKGTTNKLAEQTYLSQARTLFDRTISKLSGAGLNNIGNKLASKHSIEYLTRLAKRLGYIGSLEAIEEGQQELLQSRYQRGLYDDYSQTQSTMPLASILEDVNLATDAVAAYMGVLSGDPDNGSHQLRRAMQIGGITGLMMGGGGLLLLSNVLPSEGRDNLRNLIGQIKNDKIMDILVGDHYGVAQDDKHIGIFYDALQKSGISIDRLRNSVEDLKAFKGNLVTDDFIDRDIELLNNLYYIQEHPTFKKKLLDKGYEVGSEQHKNATIRAARQLTQLRDAAKYIEHDNSELEQQKNTVYRKVLNAAEGGIAEAADVETDLLVEIIYGNYQTYLKNRKEQRGKLLKAYDDILKNENAQDWLIHKAKEELDNFDAEHQYSYLEYVEQQLNHMYNTRFILNSELMIDHLSTRQILLNEISKELGIDVSTSRLGSMIESIKKTKDEMIKLFDDENFLLTFNNAINKLNESRKKGLKAIPLIQNIGHRLEKQYGKLPQQEEVDKIQRRMMLNRAVYDSIEPLANVYIKDKIDPRIALDSATILTWKQLSKEDKDDFLKRINELRKKEDKKPLTNKGAVFEYNKYQADKLKALRDLALLYTKHLHEHTTQDDTVDSRDVDAEAMQHEAADLLFDYEMEQHDELKRVNHREYLRESGSPLENTESTESAEPTPSLEGDLNLDAIVESLSQSTDTPQEETPSESIESPQDVDSTGENTDYPMDSSSYGENTDYPMDDMSSNTDAAREEQKNTHRKMSDAERELREKLGMDTQSTDYPMDEEDYSEDNDFPEDDDNEGENTEGLPESDSTGENTEGTPEDDSSNTDAIQDLDSQSTNSVDESLEPFTERDERFISEPDLIYTDFLGLTFKYDPTKNEAPDWISGIREEDGKTVVPIKFKNGAMLKAPSELAEKLLIPGWFDNADKYFVITADKSSVVDIKNPDNLVVAMIIQDGKDAYAVFLTGLANRRKGYTKNEARDLWNKMDRMFWSSFKYAGETYVVKDQTGETDEDTLIANIELGRFVARRSAYLQYNMDVDSASIKNDKEGRKIVNDWYVKLDKKTKNRVDLITRSFLSGGRSVFSNEHIDAQIANLRNTRNQIINALLDKDSEGNYILKDDPTEYKEAKPLNPRISDGRINDQREDGEYVLRSLLDGGFGMSSDLEELTKQIEEEQVRLGVGRGERAFTPYAIDKIDPSAKGTYEEAGKGKAGKIYFIAETVSGKNRGIMLAERKFKDGPGQVSPEDIEEAFNTDGTIKEGMTPSMAEFILYLITDRISNDVFSGIDTKYISALKEALIGNEETGGLGIIVNHGKHTWVQHDDERKQKHFAAKQFFINEEKGTLVIALQSKTGTPRSTEFDISNDRDSIFFDETQRRIVIAAIANNLHWNTPWEMFMNNLPEGILESLRAYFIKNPTATEYKIANIDDLTFTKSDLFDADMNYKNVSLIAWMLGTKKLMTTVGDKIFYAPFVYCDGAEETNHVGNTVKRVEQKIKNRKRLSRKLQTLRSYGEKILNDLGYKKQDRQDNGNVKGGLSGWKVRLVIKNPDTGTHYTYDLYANNKESYESVSSQVLTWLKQYFGLNDNNTEILKPNRGGQGHYVRKENEKTSEPFKHLAGGEIGESDFTVYIGSKDDVLKFIQDVENSEIAKLLSFGDNKTDFKFSDLIHGRVEGRSIGFSGYTLPEGLQKLLPNDTVVYKDDTVEISIIDKKYILRDLKSDKLTVWNPIIKDGINSYVSKNIKQIRLKIASDLYGEYITGSEMEVTPTLESIQSRLSKFDSERIGSVVHITEKQESGLVTVYSLLDVDAGTIEKPASEEEIKQRLKESVQRFIQYVKDKHNIELKEEDVIMPDSFEYDSVSSGLAMFTASLMPNNTAAVMVEKIDDVVENINDSGYTVQGVFSEEGTEGTLDAEKARKWIRETLGLNDSQIIVTNAVLKSVSNKTVYGVMTAMNNVLTDVVEGTFFLPKYGGASIHFHEAFHYVNLLLHSRRQRQLIYDEYIKRHPEYKDFSKRRIEELIADDFAEYCRALEDYEEELQNKNIFSRWAIKLYNRFIEFIRLLGRKDQIKLLFDNIRKGSYKGAIIDDESLLDFMKAYEGEAYKKFSAEGISDELTDNFKTISTYRQFYSVAENVAHGFIDFLNIKKAENVTSINQEAFEKYINKLRINNLRKKNPFIQDVIENPAVFVNMVNALLKQYGIVGKNKKNVKSTTDGEGQLNEQKRPDDSILQLSLLYDNYIIDLKTNVAYRAKLFLTQIRDVRFEYNETTCQNETVQKVDPETGLPLYVSFDEAWQIITSQLHEVDSFEELMSEVQRLAKTKAFFVELYKNLLSIGNDTQLQTQIYSTVNKHLTKVLQLHMKSDSYKYQEYDQEREIEIVNDSRLKAKRLLPKDWSADFFSSAAVKYDEFYHIDSNYINNVIQPNFDEIRSIIQDARSGDSNKKLEAFDKAFPKIIKLLNDMSIPFDDDVLTEYLMMHISTPKKKKKSTSLNHDSVDILQLFDAMDEIMQDPKATKEKSANIAFFVNTVFKATNVPQVKLRKKALTDLLIKNFLPKPLDELYYGFSGEMEKMAIAYNNIHPSARELSITGPGGKLVYPVGENNFISDVTRWINKNYGEFVDKLSETTYAKNSKILDVARIIMRTGKQGDLEFKLNVYVGMEDEKLKRGVDYFGINAMEDVISKMILSDNNMIVLPTMADKKTYYVLELVSRRGDNTSSTFSLPHDMLIERESEMFPGMRAQRFSDETLDIFVNYFLDELHSLEEYYDKDNIEQVVKNKTVRKQNFHGKVKKGRMDFSGNGGKFRYFYGLAFPGIPGEDLGNINLNQLLEYEYNLQKEAEDPISGDGNWYYRRSSGEMDGFESVRRRLQEIRDYFIETTKTVNPDTGKETVIETATPELLDAINGMLMRRVYDNMEKFSKPGITQIIRRDWYKDPTNPDAEVEWHWTNRAIPFGKSKGGQDCLLTKYAKMFEKIGVDPKNGKKLPITAASSYMKSDKSDALILSVIGNYTVQSIISIIEIEKVYAGDPAFYKWKYSESTEHTVVGEQTADLQILMDKDSDKIKRLGGLLSPGAELRTDFSKEEYERFPWLRGTKYVNATIKDVKANSLFFDEIKDIFTRQLVADQLRKTGVDKRRIDEVYTDDTAFKEEFNKLSDEIKLDVLYQAGEQAKPYMGINVTDAQVLIRPDMYRKIRMMLGTWSTIPQKIEYRTYTGEKRTTTYSDNEAFEILENDGEWMLDPEKAAKVSKLQLYPLKMSYFKNDPKQLRGTSYNLAYSVYNKMAIFPAFKYIMRSETGRKLYDRMNDATKGVLDMVTVESAVKVGMSQDAYLPYENDTTSLATLDDSINNPSACILENDEENWSLKSNVLNVEVQDIRGLRMLLNTEAHLDDERNIGTQMFKILFGNIYDDEDYTGGDPNGKKRSGKQIRREIMDCINALTDIGIKDLKNQFYGEDGKIDSKKVHNYFKRIALNNGLSNSVVELLNDAGTVESLMQRVLFEHSVSSLVNSSVIDIPTKGGSAVQQSILGTVSFDSNHIRTEVEEDLDKYWVPNGGRELNWNEKDGTMEVMLSLNFFKSVVPLEYQKTPKMMRNWLINHGVIKGWKAAALSERDLKVIEALDKNVKELNISVRLSKFLDDYNLNTMQDIINNRHLLQLRKNKQASDEIYEILSNEYYSQFDITINTVRPDPKREFSEGMVFGVGYRIPTQGMSSTFAFRVADILPEQAGDVIIVPREFTAQTGSDFDVDKIYLATMSFKNGVLEEIEGDLASSTKGAIANKLLQNYITVLTDIKNRSNARGSIDVVTNIIQDSTLPAIRQSNNHYREAMYELDPYFQLRRKMEFSIGKSGIGPFALNITNLALTLFAHISIDYGENEFEFGKLDEVIGQDGMRISDWLSAMINAHVDVAKDPYVFDLNINSCTYNMTNFLLRAGKGESTFLFLAQPALKEYADEYNNYGGLYGQNLRSQYKSDTEKIKKHKLLEEKINKYMRLLESKVRQISNKETAKEWKERIKSIKSGEFDNWKIVFDKKTAKEALKNPKSLIGLQFQVISLMAFDKITPYAEEMSELVKKSRIDTKKFGNTLALRRDFINEYLKFKNGGKINTYEERTVKWVNTDDSTQDPLQKYFQSTFLEKKLFASINMMNDILGSDIVTASSEFGAIINTIFGEVYGSTTITDENHNKIHPYETIMDKQVVQNMSNELENAFRHKMLNMYGPKVFELITGIKTDTDSYNYYESEKNRGYSGVIDFTFGGDQDVLISELKRIWLGDPEAEEDYERNNLFENISALISILELSDMEDRTGIFKGLVDENGRVINELLNYLKPQPANAKFDIPRLLLRKTNRNTVTSEKSKLISSFDFLLNHESETIRRIARDIAVYAYYSGYNTNSSYSFFDLIPSEYRKQYDMSIKYGVENFGSITLAEDGAENGMLDYKEDCTPLIDILCRNFYNDDKIVPQFEFPKESAKMMVGYSGTHTGSSIRVTGIKGGIPKWFSTTRNNKPYLKVQIGGETFLYRKELYFVVRDGKKIEYDERTGEELGNKWYTYVLTEKLGIHNKNLHQYELFASGHSESIFDQNKLPEKFNIDDVLVEMQTFMDKSQEALDRDYAKKKNPKNPPKQIVPIPYKNRSIEMQATTYELNDNNDVSTIYAKDVKEYIEKHSDIVIDFDTFDISDLLLISRQGISGELEGVTIGFNNIDDAQNAEETISKLFTQLENSNFVIESILVPNNEFGLQVKEAYNDGGFDFSLTLYTVSQETPKKTKKVSDKKKNALKLDEDIVNGALNMDDNLAQQTLPSVGNTDTVLDKVTSSSTDAIQESSYSGPDVINDAPQQLIHGTEEELKKKLEEHRKLLRKQNKTLGESKPSNDDKFNTKC